VPIYLPLTLAERCRAREVHFDTVLVVDASTSMRESDGAGATKLEAALAAAARFVDLQRDADQVAFVWFNEQAVLAQSLTGDKSLLKAAFGTVQTAQHTRISEGLRVARTELSSDRRNSAHRGAIVVLTDGRANPETPQAAVAEAEAARAAGVTVFAIGLGRPDDLDQESLREIAGRPEYYFTTSDARALTAIYEEIARSMPCPAADYWGRR
jgi:Mg-chelatase subunit ChlD